MPETAHCFVLYKAVIAHAYAHPCAHSLEESQRNCAHIRHTLRAPWYCATTTAHHCAPLRTTAHHCAHPCAQLRTTAHIPALNCAPLCTSLRSTAPNCAHIRQNCAQCSSRRNKTAHLCNTTHKHYAFPASVTPPVLIRSDRMKS